jgi:hypothetical protein
MNTLHVFMAGAGGMACIVIAMFFFRFWRDTRDRLFVLFALAFVGLSFNRALVALAGVSREDLPYLYVVRLAAFVLIAAAVIDKNRR